MIDHLVRTDFKAVDKRDAVGTLAGWLRGEISLAPIVCDRGRPYGVVSEKRLLRSRIDAGAAVERYVVATGAVPPTASLEDALRVAARSWVPYVPVAEDDELVGYVRIVDLLAAVDDARGLDAENLLIETPPLAPHATVGEVVHRLGEELASALPLADEHGRVRAVVTRKQLFRHATDARPSGRKAAGGEMGRPRDAPVEGYADERFETVRPRARFADVVAALDDFGAVVVADDRGIPHGIVTPESAAKAWTSAAAVIETTLPAPGMRSEGLPD